MELVRRIAAVVTHSIGKLSRSALRRESPCALEWNGDAR